MSNELTVQFEFTCIDLPGIQCFPYHEVHLGIQRGKNIIDEVPGDAERAIFRFELRVRMNPETGDPNFLGPYAQGSPKQRFVYLCWQGVKDSDRTMFRRAKVQLNHLTWAQVHSAVNKNVPLKATIHMTDKKGGPVAATLKQDLIAWHLD